MGWVNDGSGLVMAAQEKMPPASSGQIWLLSYPSGEAQRLTNDLNFYAGISLTADSRTLITARTTQTANAWIVSGFPETQVSAVAASKNKGIGGLTFAPDGKVIYSSAETGTPEIWSMDPDGNNPRQLTFDKRTSVEPVVPRGGDLMAFAAYDAGAPHIWTADRSGANLRQLTHGSYEDWPDCSPDAQWVVYHSDEAGKDRIWRIPVAGGEPMLLIDKPARHPIVSPDGNSIACYLLEGETWRLAILPFSGGEPVKSFDIPAGAADQWHGPRWSADSREITYIVTRGGVSNIWAQPANNGTARPLTNFNEGQIFAFAWSNDGKQLICVRGSNLRTVVMMKDFLGT
jgi:Tol biopolymer transport system component